MAVHEGGFRVEMVAGELRFYRPDGRLIEEAPPRRLPEEDPVFVLRSLQREEGLDISPRTNLPGRTGGGLDLD